jgi:3-dehydroquinate synthase
VERHIVAAGAEVLVTAELEPDRLLPDRPGRSRVSLLTQPGAEHHARRIASDLRETGVSVELIVLPDGEAAKTLAVAERVYRRLRDDGLHRDDTVLAVGGGSVTDLAGYVAGTYLRGIEAVYVPTTLLGAVDAAIGGKTGVDLDGKNLVGVFRHPARVLIATALLEGLPGNLWAEGAAEAFKTGMIGDPALVDLFERHGRDAPISEIIRAAVAVKVGIVVADPEERGVRAFLNYGHTVGHAVEVAGGITHGRAVSIGMVAAGWLSERLLGFGEAKRQAEILASLGLPTGLPDGPTDRVRKLAEMDKKRDAGGLRMVLLRSIGDPVLVPTSRRDLDDALRALTTP